MSVPGPVIDTIRSGGIIAFATESFYALGAAATNEEAIKALFRAKKRERNKPVALIAADIVQVGKYFHVSPAERELMEKHWPGSLTILLKPRAVIAARALGATRIGVRVPNHAAARKLARRIDIPLTATSANFSKKPPTKSAHKVKQDFPGILVFGAPCGRQTKPSTIVRVYANKIKVLRSGAINV